MFISNVSPFSSHTLTNKTLKNFPGALACGGGGEPAPNEVCGRPPWAGAVLRWIHWNNLIIASRLLYSSSLHFIRSHPGPGDPAPSKRGGLLAEEWMSETFKMSFETTFGTTLQVNFLT